jgi:Xaa-Pro aminopeptidase
MGNSGFSHQSLPFLSVQKLLKEQNIDGLLVRSTDRYFNEYVPVHLSARAYVTGFDGSVGDAIITQTGAHLFVDGRYTLQAKKQAQGFEIHVSDNGQSIENSWLKELGHLLSANKSLAYDPQTLDLNLFEKLNDQITRLNARLDPKGEDLINQFFPPKKDDVAAKTTQIDNKLAGATTAQKLNALKAQLAKDGINAFLAVKLDDIAWLTNLRSYYFPFQASIPGLAIVFADKVYFGLKPGINIDEASLPQEVVLVKEQELIPYVADKMGQSLGVLGIDAGETSKAQEIALHQHKIALKRVANPISAMKAIKNEQELRHLRSAFKKADQVVYQTQNFVVENFEKGRAITETDVDRYVRENFKKSGSTELSFRPICASGKNGAIIHYGTPDNQQTIQENSLFLLDTGAYYDGGYATDLTRTFFAAKKSGEAALWQKQMFTLVLKSSIAGLSARIRKGSVGMQLDAIVRAPLWQHNLDFAHGTGHGIGINVHEFPPRIGPTSSTPLKEGQVFSIEPGLYFENLGGVRIENLATLVEDKENPNFLRVLPLTFSPIDNRLVDYAMLDDFEQQFLDYCDEEFKSDRPWPNLPPNPPKPSFI